MIGYKALEPSDPYEFHPAIAVWDLRRYLKWPLSDEQIIYDMKSIYGGEEKLASLVAKKLGERGKEFLALDRTIEAYRRAAKLTKTPRDLAVPAELLSRQVELRRDVVQKLADNATFSSGIEWLNQSDYEDRWPFIRALREIELNGIAIDELLVKKTLKLGDGQASMRAIRSMDGLNQGGFVTTLINPMGSKTGRMRLEGGFNSLAIPHGTARNAIVSRYDGGSIVSFDFNAIDYRCIVNSVGGDFAKLYAGAQDFHQRTASFVFKEVRPDLRAAIKYLSYIYIYGGSEQTLAEKTGWTQEHVKQVLELLDKKIGPIREFRSKLWMQAQEDKFVEPPGGRRVYVSSDDSEGKVIGLYAQTYSSHVFEKAVARAQTLLRPLKSKIIFLVHDELVLDLHPEEENRIEEIRQTMEPVGHVVRAKKGKNYGEVE